MKKFSADLIFTLHSPPLTNALIITKDDGTILEVRTNNNDDDVQHIEGIICPGFVNTHCHLELSHLRNSISEKTGIVDFIIELQAKRTASEETIIHAIEQAEEEMYSGGIVAVGDISNSIITKKQKDKKKMEYHTFIELFGSLAEFAGKLLENGKMLQKEFGTHSSITLHAPYSISDKLIALLMQDAPPILSIHNQESMDENLLFLMNGGKFPELFKHFGIDHSAFKASGYSSLQTYFQKISRTKKILLVHNTFSSEEDIDFAESNAGELYWCLCPNANLYIENRLPPVELLRRKKCRITLGTDSLASNHQLSVLEEIKTLSKAYPDIPLNELLTWGCLHGAMFLGIEKTKGSIEPGKMPGLVSISNISNGNLTEASVANRLI